MPSQLLILVSDEGYLGHTTHTKGDDAMKDIQLSVFIANRPGELARITSLLAQYNINIKAISVVEFMDYGIARLITSDAERACSAMLEMGTGFIRTEVFTAELPDRPGALSELCKRLADAGINIRYVYGTVAPGGGIGVMIFSTDDDERAEKIIGRT